MKRYSTYIASKLSSFDSLLYNWMIFTVHGLKSLVIVDNLFLLLLVFDL